jgi:hypothetical protein
MKTSDAAITEHVVSGQGTDQFVAQPPSKQQRRGQGKLVMISYRLAILVPMMFVAMLTFANRLPAQAPPPSSGGYDPIQAGRDAHAYHERLRLQEVNRHLWLLDQVKWYSAWPRSGGYFSSPAPGLDEVYAYGTSGRTWHSRSGYAFGPRRIFEPWPYVPGDIWGYRVYSGVPQSIGQQQIQTGPNRWESHPVYAAPGPAAGIALPAPDPPPPAAPAAPIVRGPVEF